MFCIRAMLFLIVALSFTMSATEAAPYSNSDLIILVNYAARYELPSGTSSSVSIVPFDRREYTATVDSILTITSTISAGNYDTATLLRCTTRPDLIEAFTFNIHDVDNSVTLAESTVGSPPQERKMWIVQINSKNGKRLIHYRASSTKATCPDVPRRTRSDLDSSTTEFAIQFESRDFAERFIEMAKSAWAP